MLRSAVEPAIQTALVIAPSPQRWRILLAEDNEANIELLEYYLSAKGYDVVVARSGSEALDCWALLSKTRPELRVRSMMFHPSAYGGIR